jgi:hypothetical protein
MFLVIPITGDSQGRSLSDFALRTVQSLFPRSRISAPPIASAMVGKALQQKEPRQMRGSEFCRLIRRPISAPTSEQAPARCPSRTKVPVRSCWAAQVAALSPALSPGLPGRSSTAPGRSWTGSVAPGFALGCLTGPDQHLGPSSFAERVAARWSGRPDPPCSTGSGMRPVQSCSTAPARSPCGYQSSCFSIARSSRSPRAGQSAMRTEGLNRRIQTLPPSRQGVRTSKCGRPDLPLALNGKRWRASRVPVFHLAFCVGGTL